MLNIPPEFLLLVNKDSPLDADFAPPVLAGLDEFDEFQVTREDMNLDERVIGPLRNMSRAAKNDGVTLVVASAYRSYNYQRGVFQRNADAYGDASARRFSAPAGCSQHQLGTTVDFGSITNNFAETAAGRWISENGAGFGWSLSYPKGLEKETGYMWESWHWRWIGTAAVTMQKQYFDDVQQRLLEFWQLNAARIRAAYVQPSESTS